MEEASSKAAPNLTMREVLLADALEASEKTDLTTAIDWIEKSRTAVREGKATLEEVDASQPFTVGSEAWFFYVLLMNKPCQTLHGPYMPLIVRGTTARVQAEVDGLVCGACHKAGGKNMTTKLRRCSSCQLLSYCCRDCQRLHYKEHKADCQAAEQRRLATKKAKTKAGRFALSLPGKDKSNDKSQALIARHLTDGYGGSSVILYEDVGQLAKAVPLDEEPFWAIPTVPIEDDALRNDLLGPNEAVFNTAQYAREYDALVRWSIITPVLHKSYTTTSDDRVELPVARVDIPKIPRDTIWAT